MSDSTGARFKNGSIPGGTGGRLPATSVGPPLQESLSSSPRSLGTQFSGRNPCVCLQMQRPPD
eukprot:172667-Hanusia_phi.AAC.2